MTFFDEVQNWHKLMKIRYDLDPMEFWPSDMVNRVWAERIRLISEETAELAKAVAENNINEIADALADLTFVVLGTADAFGIPFNEVWNEVRRSNFSKVGGELDSGGKLTKPSGYFPPDLDPILRKKFYNGG